MIKFLKRAFCKMGWHSLGYDNPHHAADDPLHFAVYARCKWCGFEGQVDSQGNLF